MDINPEASFQDSSIREVHPGAQFTIDTLESPFLLYSHITKLGCNCAPEADGNTVQENSNVTMTVKQRLRKCSEKILPISRHLSGSWEFGQIFTLLNITESYRYYNPADGSYLGNLVDRYFKNFDYSGLQHLYEQHRKQVAVVKKTTSAYRWHKGKPLYVNNTQNLKEVTIKILNLVRKNTSNKANALFLQQALNNKEGVYPPKYTAAYFKDEHFLKSKSGKKIKKLACKEGLSRDLAQAHKAHKNTNCILAQKWEYLLTSEDIPDRIKAFLLMMACTITIHTAHFKLVKHSRKYNTYMWEHYTATPRFYRNQLGRLQRLDLAALADTNLYPLGYTQYIIPPYPYYHVG